MALAANAQDWASQRIGIFLYRSRAMPLRRQSSVNTLLRMARNGLKRVALVQLRKLSNKRLRV